MHFSKRLVLLFCSLAVAPLSASFITDTSSASAPSGSTSSVASVLRIFTPVPNSNNIEEGTGTVFSEALSGNVLQLGIVTAAHVINANPNGVYVGFGNGDFTTRVVTPDALVTASGGGTGSADLAYIGVSINLATNANAIAVKSLIDDIQAIPITTAPYSPGYTFNSYGYGLSATTQNDPTYQYAYNSGNPSLGFGTQRTFSNTVLGYLNSYMISDGTQTYDSAISYYRLFSGQSGTFGVSEPGDSGSAMIVNGAIAGVVEFGPNGNQYGYFDGGSNQTFGGVAFTQTYVNWLTTENSAFITPEPGTFLLFGGALVCVVGVARRRSK